jgi:hypothetical protein
MGLFRNLDPVRGGQLGAPAGPQPRPILGFSYAPTPQPALTPHLPPPTRGTGHPPTNAPQTVAMASLPVVPMSGASGFTLASFVPDLGPMTLWDGSVVTVTKREPWVRIYKGAPGKGGDVVAMAPNGMVLITPSLSTAKDTLLYTHRGNPKVGAGGTPARPRGAPFRMGDRGYVLTKHTLGAPISRSSVALPVVVGSDAIWVLAEPDNTGMGANLFIRTNDGPWSGPYGSLSPLMPQGMGMLPSLGTIYGDLPQTAPTSPTSNLAVAQFILERELLRTYSPDQTSMPSVRHNVAAVVQRILSSMTASLHSGIRNTVTGPASDDPVPIGHMACLFAWIASMPPTGPVGVATRDMFLSDIMSLQEGDVAAKWGPINSKFKCPVEVTNDPRYRSLRELFSGPVNPYENTPAGAVNSGALGAFWAEQRNRYAARAS